MKKLIIIILFVFANSVYSQWVQMSNGMGTDKVVYSLAISGNNIFVGTAYNGVYLSSNSGVNWTQTSLNNQFVYSLAISGNNIFAGSSNAVYYSTNNGVNWTQTSLNNQHLWSLAISGNNIFAGTEDGGVYLSTNNGLSWTQTALNNQIVYSLAISGNNIFAGAYYGVYLSTNNGVSWTQTTLNNQYVYSLAISGNNIFAGTYLNGVYLSTNNGVSWILKNQGFDVIPIVNSFLIANNYIFAGTIGNSVWRRNYTEAIGIKNISSEIPSSFSLSQNYPNPFNPNTIIKFQVPKMENGRMENGVITLKVFDLLGREVVTLVNEKQQPGTYEVTFDGSALSSGIYFYKLTAGDFSETKKMILMK